MAVALFVSLSFLTIRNSKDCGQLVIDTYELMSGIDIPKQVNSQCHFIEEANTRVGIYSISNTQEFIERFEFKEYTTKGNQYLWSQDALLKDGAAVPNSTSGLFVKEGQNNRSKWQCLLDENSGHMWFEVAWKK